MDAAETTSGAWTARLLMAFGAYGLDADGLCRSAGLSSAVLSDPDAQIGRAAWAKLWHQAERSNRDSNLGLHLGEVAPIEPYLIGGYALAAAESLAEFTRHHLDLQRLTFHADFFSFHDGGSTVALNFAQAPGYEPTRNAVDYSAVMFMRYFHAHFAIVPARMSFRHPAPADGREYGRIFRCRIEFGVSDNAIIFRREDFERPRPLFSEATFHRLSKAAEHALSDLAPRSFAEQVRALVHRRLGRRPVDIDAVSRALSVSTRTLQRRLTDEGTHFKQQLDIVRHRLAIDRVRTAVTLREAARAAGFEEVASFCRAFRRWTGRTPAQYRAMLQSRLRA